MSLNFDLSNVSKYRTQLMGIATILIVIAHSILYNVKMPNNVKFLLGFCNIGVDIFLFLSGIGCYYSLYRGGSLFLWYKKRYMRILFPYLLMQLPYWGYYIVIEKFNLLDALYEFSLLAFWTKHIGMWFLALLIPLYFITPFLYWVITSSIGNRYVKTILIIIVLLFVCHIKFSMSNELLKNIIDNIQWAFVRVVSFIIGLTLGQDVMERRCVNLPIVLLVFAILFVILRTLDVAYHWCVFPIMIFIVVRLCSEISIKSVLFRFLTTMGICSLEMYLANGYIRYMVIDSPIYDCGLNVFYGHYLDYFIIFIISVYLAIAVNKISSILFKCFSYN